MKKNLTYDEAKWRSYGTMFYYKCLRNENTRSRKIIYEQDDYLREITFCI